MAEPKTKRYKNSQNLPEKGGAQPTLAGEGVLLLDANLQPVSLNGGAEAILDEIEGRPVSSDARAGIPGDLLNLLNARSQNDLDGAVMYLNVRGHEYSCRTFVLKTRADESARPVLAVYLKREISVVDAVFQVGSEYRLTDREQEALIGVAMGLSSKELAVRMHISPNTVKAFLRLIMIKMGATTRAGIVGKLIDQSGRSSAHGAGRQ